MANEEHLAILKQDIEVWNKWREENPKVEVDLSKANLTGAILIEQIEDAQETITSQIMGVNYKLASGQRVR